MPAVHSHDDLQMTVDHAALMDDVYRNQRYIYDLTRKYYLFGRDRLIAELDAKLGQSVVEIGCGTARNLIKMARRYPGASFYGLDASEEMLKTAERAIARAGLSDRIRLAHGFAEDLTPAMFGADRLFDKAVFSYSLSMIPDWKQALKKAGESLSPDGEIWAVDFGDLTGLGSFTKRLLTSWLQLFHVTPRVEILLRLEAGSRDFSGQNSHLALLPARYAFLWQGGREAAQNLTA
jgi:S-adenosylmethionine-diacylgycerolhomoserine-N-methlytransferase